jgi:hypothetical protein
MKGVIDMTEDDQQRVHAARERAMAQAEEFFGSLTPEQLELMRTGAQACGAESCKPIDREELGTIYDQNGWMPKADYLEMERIISAFQTGTFPDEAAFATMLRFLCEATEAIIRARLLAFLGELVNRDDSLESGRLARIEEAIKPLRESEHDLDILYWSFVRKALDARDSSREFENQG